jgi:xylulokinase
MLFCGIDVGTTGVKAVVVDEKGRLISGAYRAFEIKIEPGGTRLLKARELLNKTKEVFGETIMLTGGKIDALCAATFGEAFICLDRNGEIICDPMLFTDRWGEKEYHEAKKKTDAASVARICGLPLSPSYSLSKILYLKEEHPDIYERIDRVLLIEDFIHYMFTGQNGVDYSAACRTMFFDARDCEWSGELMTKFGLDKNHYSKPIPMGTVIGNVQEEILNELGIRGDIKVVVGGHDQPVNAIGSGLREGCAVNSMGTSECITPLTSGILPADFIADRGIPSELLWEKGKYCCLAYNSTAGLLVQWFANLVSDGRENPLACLNENCPTKPTAIMVQPYLMGSGTPYMDSNARLGIAGMDPSSGKFEIYRAILEGLVLDQRLNLSILAEQNVAVKHLVSVGGGSINQPWLQIKADILEMPVSVLKNKEAGALGAAVLCAAALGVYGSVEEGAGEMSEIETTIEPNLKYSSFYHDKFELYRGLHEHFKDESAFAIREMKA